MGILVVSSSLTRQKKNTRLVTFCKPEDFLQEDNLCAQIKRNINDLHNTMQFPKCAELEITTVLHGLVFSQWSVSSTRWRPASWCLWRSCCPCGRCRGSHPGGPSHAEGYGLASRLPATWHLHPSHLVLKGKQEGQHNINTHACVVVCLEVGHKSMYNQKHGAVSESLKLFCSSCHSFFILKSLFKLTTK